MLGCVKMTGRRGEGRRRVRVGTPPDATAPTVCYIHNSILARGALDVTPCKKSKGVARLTASSRASSPELK